MKSRKVLEARLWSACAELGMSRVQQEFLRAMLAPLRDGNGATHVHYLHSIRVGLIARQIGAFVHHEEKPLLFAGVLHDIGKVDIPPPILERTDGWDEEAQSEIERHVLVGYEMLRNQFPWSAEVVLWHHRFQENGYPAELPPYLRPYSEAEKHLIREYGRLIAIADVYDALHRVDGKFGEPRALTPAEIRDKMLEYNPDRTRLIRALYEARILV